MFRENSVIFIDNIRQIIERFLQSVSMKDQELKKYNH